MIILASQSPYRKKLLRDFGLPFRAVKPNVNEVALKANWIKANGTPRTPAQFTRLVQFLALQKAGSIANQLVIQALRKSSNSRGSRKAPTNQKSSRYKTANEVFIIGSDQMAVVGGTRLDKPGSEKKAISQLQKLRGKTHSLITAVTVLKVSITGPQMGKIEAKTKVVTAKITLHRFSKTEMLATLKADQPYDCAGSYKLEKTGLRLVKKIEVSDGSAIIGLPLIATYELLKSLGYGG